VENLIAVAVTMLITGVVVLVPIWRRGGARALRETSRTTIPLFIGLTLWVVFLSVIFETPARASVEVVLSACTAGLAAYLLTRPEGRRSSMRSALLAATLVFSTAITLVLLFS
jgi:hypothetical protein